MTREEIFSYVSEQYGTEPEYLWLQFPTYAVLRHLNNSKWYAAVMNVACEMLGLPGETNIDILNLKLPPAMVYALKTKPGYLAAYHMNKTNWITVLLDSSVSDDQIKYLIDTSFDLTKPKMRKAKKAP